MDKEEIIKSLVPNDPQFIVDRFEEIIIQDVVSSNEQTTKKLYRDLTNDFVDWIEKKLKAKEQIKVNIKGETRSGKSLVGLKIIKSVTEFYPEKTFSTYNQVCANQKELKQKLNDVEFGDSFLIDENAFANVGIGSISEIQQQKDISGIIAKNNNHMVNITPQVFLNTGATIGLQYYGKDTKQWSSRFLLYSLKGNMPVLLGYVKFDVGSLFRETGCLIYAKTGGCTNPNRLKIDDIDPDYIKFSQCLDNVHTKSKLNSDTKQCPFFNICTSEMCNYEHKKDEWIQRELKGGLDERQKERLEIGLKLFELFFNIETNKFNVKSIKELKLKIKLKIPRLTNSKYTGTEIEEIQQIMMSLIDNDFLEDICKQLDLNYKEVYNRIYKNENKK